MKTLSKLVLSFSVLAASPSFAQNSSVLKSISKYLPSLTEIGFVTGAINCYVQTATLVRAINKEIALAKSMSQRLDDLKSETEQMLGQFGSLSDINPYDMDSWAAWLNRAQGLVSEETSDFTDILFNSVLKTLDDRMTVGFYSNVKRGLSYDASQGQIKAVLNAYYVGREYDDNREKIRAVALNTKRLLLLMSQNELTGIRAMLPSISDPRMKSFLEKRAKTLEGSIEKLQQDIVDPSLGGTAKDKQINFLMEMAQNLGQEIATAGTNLERHQQDLVALNSEWELAAKDKLPKGKNRTVKSPPIKPERPFYSATDPDKVPTPVNDVDKPTKQNTSETSPTTNLSDLLHIQNKIEFTKLEMQEDLLNMDMSLAQSRAALLAIGAYQSESGRNQRTNVTFEADHLVHQRDK